MSAHSILVSRESFQTILGNVTFCLLLGKSQEVLRGPELKKHQYATSTMFSKFDYSTHFTCNTSLGGMLTWRLPK